MLKKAPFVVESFISAGSFDYDCIRKDLGLLMWNMKPCISCNGSKSISNHIVGCSPFPTMGRTKKVGPYKILKLATNAMGHPKTTFFLLGENC
jgi:hypothetical protein